MPAKISKVPRAFGDAATVGTWNAKRSPATTKGPRPAKERSINRGSPWNLATSEGVGIIIRRGRYNNPEEGEDAIKPA